MANNRQNFSGNQADIFQQLETPLDEAGYEWGDLDITAELRGAVSKAFKLAERRGVNRERMVDELNRLMPYLKTKITLRKVNAWMASSKEDHPIPAYVIPAICAATQCDLPLRAMANVIFMDLADQREILAQELGKAEIERAAQSRKIQSIKSALKPNY